MRFPVLWGLRGAQGEVQVSGKVEGLTFSGPLKRVFLSEGEECGMRGVGVKCMDTTKNSDWEGSIPALN